MLRPLVLSCGVLSCCLSSAPPAPPIRWFDPMPEPGTAAPLPAPPALRVIAGPLVRQEFVLRTGERELVFDALHSWVAPPERLVAVALERAIGSPTADSTGTLQVGLQRFELELIGAPRAIVELSVPGPQGPGICRGEAAASDREPASLAAAMAAALAAAAAEVRARLASR